MNKNALLNIVDETKTIVDKNNLLTPELDAKFFNQHQAIKDFTAKILFVGAFSAGKSALINAFLGDQILEEDINPVTDKAHEIPLEECPDLVLVDMPGFDSGIEAHNRAIIQYIDEASAYIFVINAEDGTIRRSSIQFLNEIKNYSRFFRFVITKTDKVTQDAVDAVTQNVGEILNSELGEDTPITLTFNRDPAAHDKIRALLDQFPIEQLMIHKLGGETLMLLNQSADILQIQLDSIELDTNDIDAQISDCERQKQALERELKHQQNELHLKMQNENVSKILDDAEAALRNQLDSLASAAEQGGEIFSERVNSILRPVLVNSTQRYVNDSFNEFVDALGNINRNNPISVEKASDAIGRTANAIHNILKHGAEFTKAHEFNKAFKVLSTSLAVFTNVIAPWMELVIIFLPEIVGMINQLMGSSKEAQIKEKLQFEIIPQMRDKLRPAIQESMTEIEMQTVEDIEHEFNDAIANEINALEQLKTEKAQRELDRESKKAALIEGIKSIKLRAEEIQTAMN